MIQYLIVGALGLISLTTMCLFLLVKEGTTVGLANGILKADGKKIYSAENLKVGLFK